VDDFQSFHNPFQSLFLSAVVCVCGWRCSRREPATLLNSRVNRHDHKMIRQQRRCRGGKDLWRRMDIAVLFSRTEGKGLSVLKNKNLARQEWRGEEWKKEMGNDSYLGLTGCLLFTTMRNVTWTVLTNIKDQILSFPFLVSLFDRFSSDCTAPATQQQDERTD
jgi:hypothetical protein